MLEWANLIMTKSLTSLSLPISIKKRYMKEREKEMKSDRNMCVFALIFQKMYNYSHLGLNAIFSLCWVITLVCWVRHRRRDREQLFKNLSFFLNYSSTIIVFSLHELYVIFLWGVAVLEHNSHPDHNMGPDPCTLHKS